MQHPSTKHKRYNLQIDVINQLGQRIETHLRQHEQRLTTLPRTEASSLRTTHVKLSRDYRLVEQQFKNVQLDVKRKRSLAEVKQRELVRMEEEEKERKRREQLGGGLGGAEGEMTEEGMKWQMQIHEDVSIYLDTFVVYVSLLGITYIQPFVTALLMMPCVCCLKYHPNIRKSMRRS